MNDYPAGTQLVVVCYKGEEDFTYSYEVMSLPEYLQAKPTLEHVGMKLFEM